MLNRDVCARSGSLILVLLFFVFQAVAQYPILGIPNGAASTDTGLGGVNSIGGTILVSTGGRMERRVSVRVESMMNGNRVTSSDENGNFVFRGLPSGDYTIVIDKEKEYEPFSQRVSVIQPRGMPGQTYNLSIRITPKSEKMERSSVINADLANVPKPALDLYNKAIELDKARDHAGAIEQLKAAITQYADFMLAYSEMGRQYLILGELAKADAALEAALKLSPKAYSPMMNRAIVLYSMRRYTDAEPLLRKLLGMKDGDAVPHYFLGHTLAYLGKFDEAEKELTASVRLGGDAMKEAHRLLAIIYGSRGDKKSEIIALETYLRLVPAAPDAEQLRQLLTKLKTAN